MDGQGRHGEGVVKGGKPFVIDKWLFVRAWKQVRANKGGPGVDGVTIEMFESQLKDNLFKLWNRMSSGTYFPSPVKMVPIPKPGGGTRVLGVPTVADRVAQGVVAFLGGESAERVFDDDSFGFRPGRGCLGAVERTRQRCLRFDWVVDLDISKFFDSVDHDLLMRVVEWNGWPRWALICVERWIKAPMLSPDGVLVPRDCGTPQGGVISPVLANLFLDVAVDRWIRREFPGVEFERYADDMVCHCGTEAEALLFRDALAQRLAEVGLRMHPEKTKVVYCKDDRRTGSGSGHTSFVFLGFEFRARRMRATDGWYDSFRPAADPAKLKGLRAVIRGWRLPRRVNSTVDDLRVLINPWVRGWMAYYAAFGNREPCQVLRYLNFQMFKWLRNKYRIRSLRKAGVVWRRMTRMWHGAFYHWRFTTYSTYP